MILDRHLDLLPLADGELELVFPTPELAANFAANTRHEAVEREFPQYFDMSEAGLCDWIGKVNGGRHFNKEPHCPVYWLWLVVPGEAGPQVAGDFMLRITQHPSALVASGHVGYQTLPQFRGKGYATRALELSKNIFRAHGFESIILTCAPENLPSRRVIEKAGGRLLEIRKFSEEEKREFAVSVDEYCRFELDVRGSIRK